jgi:hypothetical protein
MSAAAIRAFVQLASAPSFWEKTIHGLMPQLVDAGNKERVLD